MLPVLAFLAVTRWPASVRLAPYISPPLDARGTRVRLLIPQGWQPRIWPKAAPAGDIYLAFAPKDWREGLPAWLCSWLGGDETCWLTVTLYRADSPVEPLALSPREKSETGDVLLAGVMSDRTPIYQVRRRLKSAGVGYTIMLDYAWSNAAGFRATQAQVARSLRVER